MIVEGIILDESGEAIPGANISVIGTNDGTSTYHDGHFQISVDEGAQLEISFIGHDSVIITADPEVTYQSITLVENAESLGEATVEGERKEQSVGPLIAKLAIIAFLAYVISSE